MDAPAPPPTVFAIEHLESRIDAWLWLEYTHASEAVDRLAFTGVRSPEDRERLGALGEPHEAPAARAFAGKRILALDPQAPEPLRSEDFDRFDVLVVGGILGEEMLRGRTSSMLTAPQALEARHLGKLQLPIDMAVVVANLVRLGMPLEEIELTSQVEVDLGKGRSVVLPYAYPVVDGQVLLTPGLLDYLVERGLERAQGPADLRGGA